ncbi:error-prone DNA polymerase [Paracidovorax citrulli]|uniref:error-prone DNA polymerase n=1 Tax=Paracidovorax citrulli TaxID=80869 RepID=UPI00255C5C48|nr:error-prone DNA polymerase [Paracidovorax citrulli]WIY36632.1 error-prone DNA polymerase [Paracidovorax citrulli]
MSADETPSRSAGVPAYAELRCASSFSFLIGASHPHELVERAAQLGYTALALTDECSLAGIVRAHVAAKQCDLQLLVGAQFKVAPDGGMPPCTLTVLACDLEGYGNLCAFITRLRRAAPKGTYELAARDLSGKDLARCVVICSPERMSGAIQLQTLAQWLLRHFMGRCWIGVEMLRLIDDEAWLARLRAAGEASALPLVATGDVHFHVRSRKPLQDTMTAVRLGRPLAECGLDLQPNAERHLRTRLRLAQTYPAELLEETLRVAARCDFSVDELRYNYPAEVVPPGETPASHLRRLTYEGAARRWPEGIPPKVQEIVEHELALIEDLRYEHYFLTVADIVDFARSRGILCQGRGSAANSAVCYCLHVTEVDPARMSVLFERFLSRERNEPPDIDIDFENARREEVIQYLYGKYGRERAALTAVVTSYRPRSALRDVGKALGFDEATVSALAKDHQWWEEDSVRDEQLQALGLDAEDLRVRQLLELTEQLLGFPRHLSQHPGGFVLTQDPLCRMVPIENAAMEDRTVIQWDKDDLDAAGLLKVDMLALGMLTAIRKALVMIGKIRGLNDALDLQDIPAEDPATYEMLCRADSIGVFQVESRAQMSMLPRLRPRCFYDLVVQVAIVRPGPIQGGMVHPYLDRRQGLVPVTYPSDALREVLGRTLGVPVFQEQVMQLAIVAAGFSAGEADGLRRAMAAWKRKGGLEKYHAKLVDGMLARGYEREYAERVFQQIHGFSEYGFPESHAASFALLVYASSWIKRHHPAAFLSALLNSQPMGFYSPSQLVQDARRHGVTVRAPDVLHSGWDCTLEDLPHRPAVRLGLRLVNGLGQAAAERIEAARAERPFQDVEDLALRADLDQPTLRVLAGGDALASLAGHRRQQVWDAAGQHAAPALLRDAPVGEAMLELPEAPEGDAVVQDYSALGLTLRSHPVALLRPQLGRYHTAEQLANVGDGFRLAACGLVTLRQQPGTAKGTIFVSIEDETGTVQVIVWPHVRDTQRDVLLRAKLLGVYGIWQREGEVCNLIARKLIDLTSLLGALSTKSRDFTN